MRRTSLPAAPGESFEPFAKMNPGNLALDIAHAQDSEVPAAAAYGVQALASPRVHLVGVRLPFGAHALHSGGRGREARLVAERQPALARELQAPQLLDFNPGSLEEVGISFF